MKHTDASTIQVPDQWCELLEQLSSSRGRVIIIGSGDSGKTTLARWLVGQMAETCTAAWVDADVGQSQIGPPATIGWRVAGTEEGHCYFVGDVSPAHVPAAALSGLLRAVRDAEQSGADCTVIDTTGYVAGNGAASLKNAKVELLAPATVLLLGDDKPVRRLLKCWQGFEPATVIRLDMAAAVVAKSVDFRRSYRRRLFAEALAGATMRWLNPADMALVRGNAPSVRGLSEGLLLGFVDEMRRLICLGLLQAVDASSRRLLVYAPAEAESAHGIIFGAMALNPAGEQLATDRS